MIVIAEPYARYSNTLPASELERAAANLLNFADEITRSHFADRYQQFEVTVAARVEIGSTRTWITIAALVHALIFYGDIRQSVDYLIKDGQHLGRLILAGVPGAIGLHPYSAEREERRLGVPGKLQRLFASVERGEITSGEATRRAMTILQKRGGVDVLRELPKLTERLAVEFEQVANISWRQLSVDFGQEANPSGVPAQQKKQAARRPELGLPPVTPFQRRRGVIASRDRTTGDIQISTY
jgi:hypothetical protein